MKSNARRVKTLLFDLDGTLIRLDMAAFLPRYFQALGGYFRHLVDPRALVGHILACTELMVGNRDAGVTNQEAFMQAFLPRLGLPAEQVLPLFDMFYAEEFPRLGGPEVASPPAQQAVQLALAAGLEVVVATNPVFPLQAIHQRLAWGGLDRYPFRLVTAYEGMHFCKPHVEYYQEILALLGREPEECWMVGNDVTEDMVAGRLGIRTFLVEDFLIPADGQPAPTRRGSMADLPAFVTELA